MIKINYCPQCGGDCSNIIPGDVDNNLCPYCGYEIYDYSIDKNQEKIENVERAKRKMMSAPKIVALTIIITFIVLIGITIASSMLLLDENISNKIIMGNSNKYTKKMEACYKNEDWDKLYEIVILDCEHSINSPAYFTYRTAWLLSCYPEQFDISYENNDYDQMKEAYDIIREDYLMRKGDMFYSLYDTVEEIELSLEEEYKRETEIMKQFEEE